MEAMRHIVTHEQLKDVPFILETPEVETMIATNLDTVRKLRDGRSVEISNPENISGNNQEQQQVLSEENIRSRRSKTRSEAS
jgi:hypothetical protein